MKKFLLFTVIFIFLAGVGWGQAEFRWTGAGGNNNWENTANWFVIAPNGVPIPDYPGGSGRVADIVVIDTDIWSPGVQLANDIKIENLTIGTGLQVYQVYINTNNCKLTVTGKTELYGIVFIIPSLPSTDSLMEITNLVIGSGNGVGIPTAPNASNVRMNGALVSMNPYWTDGPITIEPVTGDIGYISAGNRPVIINIADDAGPINVGDIDSSKNITINVGDNNDVHIGDITTDGNVVINVPPGSSVDVSDIDAGGTITTPGGGNITINGSQDTYDWIGTTDTDWNISTNWLGGNSPGDGTSSDEINIHVSPHYPVFSGTGLTCDTLIIQSGASLDMGAYNLTVTTLDNSGNLILTGSGTQSVTSAAIAVNGTVTYNAGGTHLAGLTEFNNLTIQDGDRTVTDAITVSGNFSLVGGSLDAVSIDVTGTSDIAGDITTTGTQTYSGQVELGGGVTLTGATVTLGQITGKGYSLTITGDGVFNGGSYIDDLTVTGNFTLSNNTLGSTTVSIGGTSDISGNITTTGNQTYTGAVTLGEDVTLEGNGSTVQFDSTVDGTASEKALTITNASVIFNGTVGSTTLIKSVTVIGGTTTINANIDTTENQTYTGSVTLAGTITLTSTDGSITAYGKVTGTDVTVNASQGILLEELSNEISGDITLENTGTTPTGDITFTSGSALSISLTAKNDSANGEITVIKSGDLEIASLETNTGGSISITAPGTITQTGAIKTESLTVIAGIDITLKLTNKVTGSVDFTSTAGEIEFNNDCGSTGELVVKAKVTSGDVTITETTGGLAVNGINASGKNVSLKADGSVTQTAEIKADTLTVEAGTFITLGGDNNVNTVDLTSDALLPAQGNITYNSDIGTANTLEIKAVTSGNVTITETTGGLDVDEITADGDVTLKAKEGIVTKKIDVTGVVWLEADGDIDIQDSITGERLTAIAGGNVKVGNSGDISVTSNVDHDTSTDGGKSAAIYIEANDFIPTNTTLITLGASGEMCLELSVEHSMGDFDGIVTGNAYHIHNIKTKSLVYYNSANPAFTPTTLDDLKIPFPITDYDYIDDDDTEVEYKVKHNKDIIIYQIGNTNKDVTFTIEGPAPSGSITIYGEYFAANLTLNTGSGGIILVDADIKITGDFELSNNEEIKLITDSPSDTGINSIEAANITLNVISADNGQSLSLTTTGDILFKGSVGTTSDPIGVITIDSADNVTFSWDVYADGITIVSADDVTFSGDVHADSITIDSADDVTFSGNVNATSISVDSANDVTFSGDVHADSISVKADGAVTQTGAIKADTLIVEAGKSITLTSSANEVADVDLASASGDIEFVNGNIGGLVVKAEADSGYIKITETAGGITVDEITASGDVTLDVKGNIGGVSGILKGNDITVNAGGNISLLEITGAAIELKTDGNGNISLTAITGADVVINAGGNITLTAITGGTVELNAGYPEHDVFGTSGTVTLTDLNVTDLTIWCEHVFPSPGGTGIIGNVVVNTDDMDEAEVFLNVYSITSTSDNNKLRPNNYELVPKSQSRKYPNYNHLDSEDPAFWSTPIDYITGSSKIYITGTITAWGDLTINTKSGDIVFEGDYDAAGFELNLKTEGGKVIQESGTITVDNKFTIEAKGEIIQNGGIIIADDLNITTTKSVTLAKDNTVGNLTISAGEDVEFTNDAALEISGITGAKDVTLTVNGNIDLSGEITASNDVILTVNGDIDLSANITASLITIKAGSITGSGIATASTGDISFINSIAGNNNISLNNFNAPNGTINVSVNTKDIVYYSSAPPSTPPSGGTWTTPLFVEANSVYDGNVELHTLGASDNIYLADVVDSSGKTLTVDSSAGTGSGGFIEFFTTETKAYTYSGANPGHLQLTPGEGGIRIAGAVVEIAGNFNTNGAVLTLDGAAASVIKAANITLGDIAALGNEDLTLEAETNIIVSGQVGAAGSQLGNIKASGIDITFNSTITTAGGITLEAGGNISLNNIDANGAVVLEAGGNINLNNIDANGAVALEADGNISINNNISTNDTVKLDAGGNITITGAAAASQLIAVTPAGTVSVGAVVIDSSNTGYERETAAIYVAADTFVVTTTAAGSIVPGGTGGQLCLELNIKWTDGDGVVDGPEDNDPPGMVTGARWHQHVPVVIIDGKILYSFTEDSDGNGRLDRIRVQTNVTLNGDFTGFAASVDGYEIKGYQMVSELTGSFDNDSFYIYLKEKLEIDGGNTPLWSVTQNESLKNTVGSIVGDKETDINLKPVDTIPPRIAYTLTLPGHPQTYVQMSENVVSNSGAVSASFDGVSSVNAQTAASENTGYLFNHSNSYGIDVLASLPDIYNDGTSTAGNGYFQIDNIQDKEPQPDWNEVDPAYPPKYPLNWGYTAYAKVINDASDAQSAAGYMPFSGVFTPPNKLLTVDMMSKLASNQGEQVVPNNDPVIRRVTDVLVSMTPTNTGSDNYFVWPVWARFKKSLNSPYTNGNDVFWGQQPADTGIIWKFDGTSFLETNFIETNEGIELQARINNSINIKGNPVLFWTTADVPAENRNPQEAAEARKAGGLWLPVLSPSPLYYYLFNYLAISPSPDISSTPPLFNYDIAANGLVNDSGGNLEFIFRFSDVSDMFAARLDAPPGIIPGNWYTLIRPFIFEIHNIRRQRGGVTILNNVINSNNREVVYIRYHLLRPGRVTVQVYTLDGTLVKSLRRNEQRGAGEWTEGWDGTNNGGRAVARGMYFVRVVGPDIDEIRKIMVIK